MKSLFAWFRRQRSPKITLENARSRVARGAGYLDEVDPGWSQRIDLEALALADGRSCVLGQLHQGFRAGLGRARLFNVGSAPRASLSPVAYGFYCVQGAGPEAEQRDYAFLDRAWREEIRRRREDVSREDPPGAGDRSPAKLHRVGHAHAPSGSSPTPV